MKIIGRILISIMVFMLLLNLVGGTFGAYSYIIKYSNGLDIGATMVIIGGFGYFTSTIIYYAIRNFVE